MLRLRLGTTFPRYTSHGTIRYLITQARHLDENSQRDCEGTSTSTTFPRPAGLATPRQLTQFLDEYVVGQENAKKVLSVAVFNHYNRVRSNLVPSDLSSEAEEPATANVQPHPYRVSSSQPFATRRRPLHPLFEKSNVLVIGPTGSGKTLLAKTLARVLDVPFSVSDATSFTQAGYVGEDVEMCIHRLLSASGYDERRASTGIVYIDEIDKIARKTGGIEGQRDVGGEGVQQALLRIMEGANVTIHAKPMNSGQDLTGGDGRSRTDRNDAYTIDTTNVLFILSGAFVGLEGILHRRLSKGSIGFTAQLDGSLPFFTPNHKTSDNVLDMAEPADLVKYGFIPEFMGRLPIITSLAPLTTTDLFRILTDAAERGGGARGLRGIMESILLDAMYEVPGSNIKHVLITEAVVQGKRDALCWQRDEGSVFWTTWAEEESLANH
ncbi:ATPase regulatory subunit [Pyrrhoderma noxium]|uniref:ATPase regulatory subunit n=1 Tax=Pyrrhoderma noxium TaxID=2282107 RepID=A0A286UN86_9AGAM|nr:ATPase regulatory subunit [Pyrrhoderma noxium]